MKNYWMNILEYRIIQVKCIDLSTILLYKYESYY